MTIICPKCSAPNEIPDDRFDANSTCAQCGARLTPDGNAQHDENSKPVGGPLSADVDKIAGAEGKDLHDQAIQALAELKKVTWEDVFPYADAFTPKNLYSPLTLMLLFFVLVPLIIAMAEVAVVNAVVLTVFYFSMVWVFFFYPRLKAKKLLLLGFGCMAFTAIIGMIVLKGLYAIPIFKALYNTIDENKGMGIFGYVLAVGPLEEFVKMLPLLIFGMHMKKITCWRDGLFLGVMSGLGFAIAEAPEYVQSTVMRINDAIKSEETSIDNETVQLLTAIVFHRTLGDIFIRALALSMLHGAWCGIVGFSIGNLMKKNTMPKWPTIVVAGGIAAALHGLYDTFSGNIIGLGLAVVTLAIFSCFITRAEGEANEPDAVVPAEK